MATYYKVLDADGRSTNGGDYQYDLPTKNADGTWTPGKWTTPVKGELELCNNGYHLCEEKYLIDWLDAAIYEAEYKGQIVVGDNKVVVRRVRLLRKIETWTERSAREFACWCVRNTPARDGKTTWDFLTDERSKNAVEVSERFAAGEATETELDAARA